MSEPNATPHALITGGAGGLGRGIATVLARAGYGVALADFRADALEETAARLRSCVPGCRVGIHVVDLAAPGSPGRLIADVWNEQPLDVVVNAAGIYPSTPLLELDATTWDAVLDVNLRAAALVIAEYGRLASASGRGGSIVNITSGSALRAREAAAPYATSKAALEMLTRAAALELGRHAIRVNAVSPGFVGVDSPVSPYLPEYREAVDRNPLGRPGSPEDVGEAVLWLAGPLASWVTGTVVRVDGGSSTGSIGLPRSWPVAELGSRGGRFGGDR